MEQEQRPRFEIDPEAQQSPSREEEAGGYANNIIMSNSYMPALPQSIHSEKDPDEPRLGE
jgi:hypothetical protein